MFEKREREEATVLSLDQAMVIVTTLADALDQARRTQGVAVPVRGPERRPSGKAGIRALAQLPVIGGPDFDADSIADRVGGKLFQSRYQRGTTVSIYVAANEAFRTAGRTMRGPVYKIGMCSSERLHQRQLELDRDGYGGMVMREGKPVRDPAFGPWDMLRTPSDLQLSSGGPVGLGERDLRVTLPAGMKVSVFDELLTEVLKPASLSVWAGSAAGQRYCEAQGLEAETLMRFTAYQFGSRTRLSPATELMIFRPKSETQRLASIIAGIIADWLLLQP